MADLATLRSILMSRVQLKAYEQETDSTYKILSSTLDEIITNSVKAHNPSYTLANLPEEEVCFVLWLAEIEVYFDLASGNSRFFSISAEGAEINKQQRVLHYIRLIEGRQRHYDAMWARFKELNPDQIKVSDIYTSSPNLLKRTWRLSPRPSIVLTAPVATSTSIDLQWTTEWKKAAKFVLYKHSSIIVDEWEEPIWHGGIKVPVAPTAEILFITVDKYRDKYRVRELTPATTYHFAVAMMDSLGRYGYNQITKTTLA